ncbi:hypothetical protein Tco_0390867 [Tanacetum coccineum]
MNQDLSAWPYKRSVRMRWLRWEVCKSVPVLQYADRTMGRIRAFEQETQDLNVEIKQMNELRANYGVTPPPELRRDQVNEEMSRH